MHTYTGRHVFIDNEIGPSVEDIAVALGRITRFAGATEKWWSVLHHSVICETILMHHPRFVDLSLENRLLARLYILLHDGHECIISDIPTTWKTEDMRTVQKLLDHRIRKELEIPLEVPGEISELLQEVDEQALYSEAAEIGVDALKERFTTRASFDHRRIVATFARTYKFDDTASGIDAPLVKYYIKTINILLSQYRSYRGGIRN
jgi:5'-deoxynucleotidase YfbR-like HD superfamily hydrolase